MKNISELSVITKAKEMCSYILTVTEKSPKRFRFTLTGRLQNYSLSIIECLLKANEIRVLDKNRKVIKKQYEERIKFQQEAFTNIKILSYMSQLSMEQGCILPKQYEIITKYLYDCQNMIGAWVKSDKKRYAED